MTLALKLLCRVVRRRVNAGEALESVLADYPRLTAAEKDTVREHIRQSGAERNKRTGRQMPAGPSAVMPDRPF